MKYARYEYKADDELHYYEFTSTGKRGWVKKVVEYSKMNIESFYNLAFGDYDEDKKEINDTVVTNNGDSIKVLTTVASTIGHL